MGGAQMQKACAIIAITAIALGASQLAPAQTSDQSPQAADGPPRAADPSSSARDGLKARLEEAGFSNIQIMSESFLVRAIGPDGRAVMMVVRPDSQAIMPETPEDEDAMGAGDPGDPEALGDLSEDDEQGATAPTPRNHHFGTSSKLMDRAPGADSEPALEFGRGIGKSDKLTGRRDNQDAAQPAGQSPNRFADEAAKMRDEGVRQSAGQTTPGRPDGMPADVKESERPTLDLTGNQRAEIWKQLGAQQAANLPAGFHPQVGAIVPASLQLKSLPNSISSEVPQVQSYDYAMVQSQLLIVDPATKKIVSIITE
jgi:Protein of unknown function (DUF1236)